MSLKDIETEFDKLVSCIAPIEESNVKRKQVTSFIRNVITSQVERALIVECGSSALKTYLPEGDLDLILFSRSLQLSSSDEMSYLKRIFNALCDEVVSREDGPTMHGDQVIRNVEFINARTKVTHCLVNNVSVDITVDHSSALISLLYLEEIDREIGLNHLFKRSVLLIKVWCTHETFLYCGAPILGAKSGMLSSYAISTLVVHLFNRYDVQLLCSPLAVLRCFLFTYMNFPWETHVLTVAGGVPIVNGSNAVPSVSGHSAANTVVNKFQHVTDRINAVVNHKGQNPTTPSNSSSSSGSGSSSSSSTAFSLRSCNIQDPTDPSNNLGISVSRANLGCIERSLQMGFSHLESLLTAVLSARPPPGSSSGNSSNNNNGNGHVGNKIRSNSMHKTSSSSGGAGVGVNGNGKRHSFTNGTNTNGYNSSGAANGGFAFSGEVAVDGVNRTQSPSSSDDSSGATTVSSGSGSSQSLLAAAVSGPWEASSALPPPFPSMASCVEGTVSDTESVTGSVSSFGTASYASSSFQGGYPNQHYKPNSNAAAAGGARAALPQQPPLQQQQQQQQQQVYQQQQGDSRYTSPSSASFAMPPPPPPQMRYLPHLSLPQPFMQVLPPSSAGPMMMIGATGAGTAAAGMPLVNGNGGMPMPPFVPVTPSNHLRGGGGGGGASLRAPSPSAAAAAVLAGPPAAVLEAQQVLVRFFPHTVSFYLIDGQTATALRSDLMEHPLQQNYKHMRIAPTVGGGGTATAGAAVEAASGSKQREGSDVYSCDVDNLWKILKTISSPPVSPISSTSPPPPVGAAAPTSTPIQAPPVLAAASTPAVSAAGMNSSETPAKELKISITKSSPAPREQRSEVKSVAAAATTDAAPKPETTTLSEKPTGKVTKRDSPESVDSAKCASPEVSSESVLVSPAPVKPAAASAAGSSKKGNKNNVTPTKTGVKTPSTVPAAPLSVNGKESKTTAAVAPAAAATKTSPSSVIGSDNLMTTTGATTSTSAGISYSVSGQSKWRQATKVVLCLLGVGLMYAGVQALISLRGRAQSQDSQICTSNVSEVKLSQLSLSLDEALNVSSKGGKSKKTPKTSEDSSVVAAKNETRHSYAVTHWIELNSSITFGDFTKSGFPNYYYQQSLLLLPSLNNSGSSGSSSAGGAHTEGVSVGYQWTKDNVNITTARAPYYTVKSAQYTDGGYYRCFMHITRSVVVNVSTGGTTTSTATPSIHKGAAAAAATKSVVEKTIVTTESHLIAESIVYVTKEPSVKDTASYQIVKAGSDFKFALTVEGNPPPTFQWFKNGYLAEGQTNQSIVFPNITLEQSGTYSCKVENFAGGFEWKDITIMVHH